MLQLIIASHNVHKCQEIQAMLGDMAVLTDLNDNNIHDEIPETGDTFEANALQKARFVYERTGADCFADDSGLMVDALGGAPGVMSARYAGEPSDMAKNIDLLLHNLTGVDNRSARFVTVIAAIIDGKEHLFRGEVKGQIISSLRGTGGFGYDPLFVPDGYSDTFAQLPAEVKNSISHRARAIGRLRDFIINTNK